MSIDLTPSLKAKGFYRFTGPPENWLTAIKFMTWGVERKYLNRWQEMQAGDIFFMHSTVTRSQFKNAKSGIVGIGVIGSNFSEKENFLWLQEQQERENRWPLLVPISEIYLFSEIPPVSAWDNPSDTNRDATKNLIDQLLTQVVPLSAIKGFPQMGSFSAVSDAVADQILNDTRPLNALESSTEESIVSEKKTELVEIKDASESLRYAETLKVFDRVKKRLVSGGHSVYARDNELLERAETSHMSVLQDLVDMFRSKGYETRQNKHVDLFAYNKTRSFLVEVKSTENKNFQSQARKGLTQLLEYNHFEISSFEEKNKIAFKEKHKILVPSRVPRDELYVGFLNALQIGVGTVQDKKLVPTGIDFGFSSL